MAIAIRGEKVSKSYLISHQHEQRYVALRDVMAEGAQTVWRKLRYPLRNWGESSTEEEFFALQDVSFEIPVGARVGILGRNGAGKSTLLKVLSRITAPTSGRISLRGRVSSLLEVGTGFHPELTGRENIYLNGAILGMRKAEIRQKFDQIVEFAEVDQFLDTPVKRYSSGMYVRLAFAVAAHLEPEILIVDEVLAVGDAQFQKKCLGKMREVGGEGRTVLFVSHNMNAIEQLCTSAMLLDRGRVVLSSDDVREVIHRYNSRSNGEDSLTHWVGMDSRFDNPWFKPISLSLVNSAGEKFPGSVRNDDEVFVQIVGECGNYDDSLQVGYALYTEDGALLYWTCHTDGPESGWPNLYPGRWVFRSRLPPQLINEGSYRIDLLASRYNRQWLSQPGINAPSIVLEIAGGLSESPYWMARRPGVLAPVLGWSAESEHASVPD